MLSSEEESLVQEPMGRAFTPSCGGCISAHGASAPGSLSVSCLPKYWSFSFSISPCNEYSGLISYRTTAWFDLLAVHGTLKGLLQNHSSNQYLRHLLHQSFGPRVFLSFLFFFFPLFLFLADSLERRSQLCNPGNISLFTSFTLSSSTLDHQVLIH